MGRFLLLKNLNFVPISNSCTWPKVKQNSTSRIFYFSSFPSIHMTFQSTESWPPEILGSCKERALLILGSCKEKALLRGTFTSESKQDYLFNASKMSVVLISSPTLPLAEVH